MIRIFYCKIIRCRLSIKCCLYRKTNCLVHKILRFAKQREKERERERERVCVCVREKERENAKETERKRITRYVVGSLRKGYVKNEEDY